MWQEVFCAKAIGRRGKMKTKEILKQFTPQMFGNLGQRGLFRIPQEQSAFDLGA
jgi:hypothetical protein